MISWVPSGSSGRQVATPVLFTRTVTRDEPRAKMTVPVGRFWALAGPLVRTTALSSAVWPVSTGHVVAGGPRC